MKPRQKLQPTQALQPTPSRQPTIARVLRLSLLPTFVFAVAMLLVSAGVVWWLTTTVGAMADQVREGTLAHGTLLSLGDTLSLVWLGCMAAFLVATGWGFLWAHRAHRSLVARLDRAGGYAAGISRGEPASALQVLSADALGRLEEALSELGVVVTARERELRLQSERRAFDTGLHRALKMARDEARVYAVARRALMQTDAELASSLLLADSSRAHLRAVVSTPAMKPLTSCGVGSPRLCPAAADGHEQHFPDSDRLDCCPHLQANVAARSGAACYPVSIGGMTVGVIQARFAPHDPPAPGVFSRLESIAHEVGTRLGVIRALQTSQLAASTDPLTGLLNRRSMEAAFTALARTASSYVVVMADIDHFKRLNDTHGHETGDRALRVFSHVLQGAVRAGDVVCRYGGEEFVLLLPECPVDEAARVVARLCDDLSLATAQANVPAFTASFGISTAPSDVPVDETVAVADGALYEAKEAGRACTVIAGRGVVGQEPHPSEGAPPQTAPGDSELRSPVPLHGLS